MWYQSLPKKTVCENGAAGAQPENQKYKAAGDPRNFSEEQLGGYFAEFES